VRAPRKEVVVAITSLWNVYCFDHNLKLMWETDLSAYFDPHATLHEASILVAGHAVREDDRGMVIVGGSVLRGDLHSLSAVGHGTGTGDVLGEEATFEQEKVNHYTSAVGSGKMHGEEEGDEELRTGGVSKYFSYFAFEGERGSLRWKHEANDFTKNVDELSLSVHPQHDYKFTEEEIEDKSRKEFGEVSCQEFRESVIESLPHKWEKSDDTLFKLAHFSKHKEVAKGSTVVKKEITASKGTDPSERAGINHGNVVAKAISDMFSAAGSSDQSSHGDHPHSHSHSHDPPNVFVAHLADGIQAIHLYTGRTVCKLHLSSPGLHADINGDGLIEHIQVFGKEPGDNFLAQHAYHHALPGCSTLVTAGMPAHEVFNASVCKYKPSSSLFQHQVSPSSSLEVQLPALLPLSSHRIAADPHHDCKQTKYDLVFLNSYGEVTCLSTQGHRKWSVQSGSSWQTQGGSIEDADSIVPTITTMELRIGGHNDVILSAGATSANILSVNGKKMRTLGFPEKPTLPLQVMDFNADGLNDIVLCTSDGFYGYAQVRHFSTVPFTGLLGCLVIAMIAVYVSLHGVGKKAKVTRGTDVVDD